MEFHLTCKAPDDRITLFLHVTLFPKSTPICLPLGADQMKLCLTPEPLDSSLPSTYFLRLSLLLYSSELSLKFSHSERPSHLFPVTYLFILSIVLTTI